MISPLDKRLNDIKWGDFKIENVLQWQNKIVELDPLTLDSNKVSESPKHPFYGQSTTENGVISYIDLRDDLLNNKLGKPTILIHSNNQNIVYLERPFYLKDGHGATSVLQAPNLNKLNAQFIMASIARVISKKFAYNNKATKIALKNTTVSLPIREDGEIDFEIMELFIAELESNRIDEIEAYLSKTGLENYLLTDEEKSSLDEFKRGCIAFREFEFKEIFDSIKQGRRLKKDDQISGYIPFVMSGITNTGVVNYISNPVAKFKKNAITVDIFGNSFYRNYDFGAGDDTGVYWSKEHDYSKEVMLFFTASMNKALSGRFDYGNKLRSSQSLNMKMKLPVKIDQPDIFLITTLISAMQKIIIKDVVQYVEQKSELCKSIIEAA